MYKLILLVALAVVAAAERRRYDGYQLWTTTPETDEQIQALNHLRGRVLYYSDDFLKGYEMGMLVPVIWAGAADRELRMVKLSYNVKRENFQQYMDETWERLDNKPDYLVYDYEDYNLFADFEEEMVRLQGACPAELNCELESVGTTWEGRNMWRFKIENSASPADQIIWIDSLTHAREWLSGATTMLLLRHIVEDYTGDTEVQDLLSRFSFYFMPVVNPDGYEYTWTNDRFWRKNCRPADEGTGCLGVDLNRNYDYVWGQHSSDSCFSEVFHGPSPASEPETQAMQAQATSVGALVWISYHTVVPIWLLPYAHRENNVCQIPDNYDDEMMPAAQAAVEAIASVNGEAEWGYGSVCLVLATASGDSLGYGTAVAGIRFVYAPELRGPDFDPPPSVIPLSYEENWAGLVALLNEAESIVNGQ